MSIHTNSLLFISHMEISQCLVKYRVPYIVFSDPEIAVVGLTEKSVPKRN